MITYGTMVWVSETAASETGVDAERGFVIPGVVNGHAHGCIV